MKMVLHYLHIQCDSLEFDKNNMKALYTILLLIVSNVFMTFAWYGHLKMKQEYSWFAALPLIGVIAFSWSIAFFEYSCQIPVGFFRFIILKKSEKPTKQDYAKQRKMLKPTELLLHLQMTIPSACHKNIRHDQQ